MHQFDTDFFEKFLSQPYLSDTAKERLRSGLKQFYPEEDKWTKQKQAPKNYTHFYLSSSSKFLLQGDIFPEIRLPIWNEQTRTYEKNISAAMLVSSTCDLEDGTKNREISKEILFAPIVAFEQYIDELKSNLKAESKVNSIKQSILNQEKSNIFYLPPIRGNAYIVMLDKIFSFPSKDLVNLQSALIKTRIASLDYFGYYLFLLKISYHLCRLPEDKHR